jgi:S-adenosylmethionine:tRNA ribosyltransferase-isomerase
MQTSLFDYHLPESRIAQRPMEPREQAKLLVVEAKSGALEDRHIFDLPSLLRPDDLLIFNDSKVFKARLRAKTPNGKDIEIFLLRPEGETWLALAKPARSLNVGDRLSLSDPRYSLLVTRNSLLVTRKNDDGTLTLDFEKTTDEVFTLCDELGEVPSPPYVEQVTDLNTYQTVYAKETGSVAAPTAGFHFTEGLLKQLDQKGVRRAFVTLHVGLGTFRPMKSEMLDQHVMHEEWAYVPPETFLAIEETRARGGRVIAVGTTTVRALESGGSGFTKLFITPGYRFKMIDGLITNFHLPKSTLIVLVSAFAAFRRGGNPDEGRKLVLQAYQHAIENEYRFYSFGDAMMVL